MDTVTNKQNNFQEFNQFQTYFYTNVNQFNMYSNFEIKRNSVALLTNICKGYPMLAKQILDIWSPEVKGIESPAIIKALQRAKFINGFSKVKVPQYIYYKNMKPIKVKVPKVKVAKVKNTKKLLEFEPEIIDKIQTILLYDRRDYEDFKFSDKVQTLGINLTTNMQQ